MSQEQESKENKNCECVRKGEKSPFRDGKCKICYGKKVKEQNARELQEKGEINIPF